MITYSVFASCLVFYRYDHGKYAKYLDLRRKLDGCKVCDVEYNHTLRILLNVSTTSIKFV